MDKVAGLCIRNKKLLVVHKRGETALLSLGGKREPGESDFECLRREVQEEVGCNIVKPVHFATYEGMAHDGKRTLRMTCYVVELEGDLRVNPADQIDGFVWVERDYEKQGVELAGMLHSKIVPDLVKRGLL